MKPPMATYETKHLKLSLISVKSSDKGYSAQLYRRIRDYKSALPEYGKKDPSGVAEIYKKEISKCRRLLRKNAASIYTWSVLIKKYDASCQIEHKYDLSEGSYGDMVKKVVIAATSKIRKQVAPRPMLRGWANGKYASLSHGTKDKGYVFHEEGTVLKFHVQKNMKQLLQGKVPSLPRRYVGIELEFCAPIKEEQLAVKLFQKGIHKYAQLKHDGSLRPHAGLKENGFELAILLEESNYKKGLKTITDVLTEIKAIAKDRRCGLHVHIDMRRRNKELVYNNLVACQFALLAVVNPERHDNEFCKVVKGRKFPLEFTGDRQERYKTINAAAYYKYRTLEIRMHEGSVNFDEISNWVDLLVKVSNYPKQLKNDVTKLPLLNTRMKLKKKLYNYAIERSCSFQVQNRNINLEDNTDAPIRRIVPPPIAPAGRNLGAIIDYAWGDIAVPDVQAAFEVRYNGITVDMPEEMNNNDNEEN